MFATFKNVILFLNICLAVLGGLSCSTWALHCSAQASLFVASRLLLCSGSVAPWHVGFSFPDQGAKLCPLHWKADY